MTLNKNIEIQKRVQDVSLSPLDAEYFTIKEIRVRTITTITYPRPFYDATMGPFSGYTPCFVQLMDSEGAIGESEFPQESLGLLKNIFAPILLQSSNSTYAQLYEKMFWGIRNEGFRGGAAMALGHLDRIFYDLAAKRKGIPVYQYLGGTIGIVKAYASGGSIKSTANELLEECQRWEAEGYDTIKIKFGGLYTSVHEDVDRIVSIREALQPKTQLAIDANQSMSLKKSLELVKAISDLDIAWLEEPIHSASLHEIAELCEHSDLKISYGESERSAKVFPSIIKAGVAHLQPIAAHISSIKDWLSIAEQAKECDLDFTSGGVSYTNAQFVAVTGEDTILEFLEPVIGPLKEVLLYKPEVKNGYFELSDQPGLGVAVDWKRMRKENKITGDETWK